MTEPAPEPTFEPTVAERLAGALAGTQALVDLDALAGNVAAVLARLPAGAELMAVVKANAYGHGLVPCARAALAAGATRLGVARVEEGLRLRAAGIDAPILVLGPANPALAGQAARAGLALAVGSLEGLAGLLAALPDGALESPLRLHLKLDTGMRRFGVDPAGAPALARAIGSDRRLVLEGLFTHFATADEADDGFLRTQAERFAATQRTLAALGIRPPLLHMANSAALLRGVVDPDDVAAPGIEGATLVARAGLILYGLSPSAEIPAPDELRPVLSLRTRLARVFDLAAGEGISYGLTYRAPRPTRCATLPIGYGDGLPRGLSNRGWALVRGAVCPIRGRVCMDQTVIEVADAPDAAEGDEAILLGDGRDPQARAMTAEVAAGLLGTINYEVVTAIAARVPRLYLRAGRPVALEDLFGLSPIVDTLSAIR